MLAARRPTAQVSAPAHDGRRVERPPKLSWRRVRALRRKPFNQRPLTPPLSVGLIFTMGNSQSTNVAAMPPAPAPPPRRIHRGTLSNHFFPFHHASTNP